MTLVEYDNDTICGIASHIEEIISYLGYDPQDQHFQRTPYRVAKWMVDYRKQDDAAEAAKLLEAVFDDEHDSMVIVGPTTVRSFCAHHWLPVVGRAWVGYLPNGKVVGLSKLSRVVTYFAQQFTVQERVTQNVANILDEVLQPKGVMVVIEAEHGCMTLRGVKEAQALTRTSAVRGVFKTEESARAEFLRLIGGFDGK